MAVKEGFGLRRTGLVGLRVVAVGRERGDRDERRKAAAGDSRWRLATRRGVVELETLGGLFQASSCLVDQCCGARGAAIRTAASIGFNGRFRLAAMSASGRLLPNEGDGHLAAPGQILSSRLVPQSGQSC